MIYEAAFIPSEPWSINSPQITPCPSDFITIPNIKLLFKFLLLLLNSHDYLFSNRMLITLYNNKLLFLFINEFEMLKHFIKVTN